jgi:O-antigen ligase
MYELGSIDLKKVSNKILHGDVNEKVSLVLNVVLVIYAALLPLSGAFSTHTGPYIILFLWIFEGNLINKYRKLKKEHVFLAFYALFGIYLISFLWTNNLKEGIHSLKYYLSMIIIMSVYFTSLRKKIIPYTIGAFLSSMFLSEIISYGIFLDLWRVGSRGTPENPSPFMHHIKYSIFLAITIFILVWQILNKKTDLKLKILESVFLVSATIYLFLMEEELARLDSFLQSSYLP